jgi:GTPase Era involved in 16S rRNA processing
MQCEQDNRFAIVAPRQRQWLRFTTTMTYSLVFYDADGVSEAERRAAERRFRDALESTLGDADLVVPVYRAYLSIVGAHGDSPAPEALTDAERAIFDQWQAAETAAVTAAFGSHRYMGDAMYEIRLD